MYGHSLWALLYQSNRRNEYAEIPFLFFMEKLICASTLVGKIAAKLSRSTNPTETERKAFYPGEGKIDKEDVITNEFDLLGWKALISQANP